MATIKVIREVEKDGPNHRGNIKVIISETGEMIKGVQNIKFEEDVHSPGKLVLEIYNAELELEFIKSDVTLIECGPTKETNFGTNNVSQE